MADSYLLSGSWTVTPNAGGDVSGCPEIITPINETLQLGQKQLFETTLTADAPVVVDFGGVTDAAVLFVSCNRKVRVRVTSSDGTDQAIPVDDLLQVISKTVFITALDLTRVTGQDTKVKVFLGERA
jgi:hypothetical protein